ncbi:MAG: hypothetical protein IT259_11645 [Saprospiraceae bacterium]|nr:hypothetical protein [Saprospiraceae bacterium]
MDFYFPQIVAKEWLIPQTLGLDQISETISADLREIRIFASVVLTS